MYTILCHLASFSSQFGIVVCLVAWFTKTATFQQMLHSLVAEPAHFSQPSSTAAAVPANIDDVGRKFPATFDPKMDEILQHDLSEHSVYQHPSLDRQDLVEGRGGREEEEEEEVASKEEKRDNDRVVSASSDRSSTGGVLWSDVVSSVEGEGGEGGVLVTREAGDGFGVRCEGGEACWRPMLTTHWPQLLEHYGYHVESRWETQTQSWAYTIIHMYMYVTGRYTYTVCLLCMSYVQQFLMLITFSCTNGKGRQC